jgi:transcriptional regulator with GAF, ATPase, and Fis domain
MPFQTNRRKEPPVDGPLSPAAAELLRAAVDLDDEEQFAAAAAAAMLPAVGADYIALVAAVEGRWAVVGAAGAAQPLPTDLLAEALDRQAVQAAAAWLVVPLASSAPGGGGLSGSELLAAHLSPADNGETARRAVEPLLPACRRALASVRGRAASRRRVERLETLLQIATRWNQTRELEPLLTEIAQAATRLLGAERASIFLWDRPNHLLVGRPALGTPDGELRIADDCGVVGRVIADGRPRRVDSAVEPRAIDRHVDEQLGYRTRTLLCVPLLGRTGELFGAFEAINKLSGPFTAADEEALTELAAQAAVALENLQDRQALLDDNRRLVAEAAEKVRLIGASPPIEALRGLIRRVAQTDLAVLILGENGTGKEVVAQSIHYLGPRREKPFVAVNCAAIAETLAESELFGHEKGAFTDARQARQGKFELAAGGTLLLDEIGELSLACQAKLLRVLEEKTLVRVGGSTPIHADVRLLAATNQNLAAMVREKRFREDLYFRLNVVVIDVPPLRERGEDVLLLVEHFLEDFCRRARRKTPRLTAAARRKLMEHSWPGNVRELRNLMERLAYLSSEDQIDAAELAFILSPRGQTAALPAPDQSLAAASAEFQREYIRRQIEHCGGNVSLAAARLGLQRSNLYRKMKQLGMPTT